MSSKDLSQGLTDFEVPGANFGFTGANIDDLASMEQTLYGLVVDESGSTMPFRPEMSKATVAIVDSLRESPRADNLMYRMTHFSNGVREIHGFKELQNCHPGDYDDLFEQTGQTDLYDATLEMSEAIRIYGEKLAEQSYMANGILVVITDGCDFPGSTHGMGDVKRSFEQVIQGEILESMNTILLGVNIHEAHVKQKLEEFHREAGFTQFECVEDASKSTMAKLAQFVSDSVSSQSQALGTGGASQSLTF